MSAPATPRVASRLAPGERDALRQLAHQGGEPIATTAGRVIRAALADHANPREILAFTDELRRTATWLQDRARRGR